ncbi:carboxyl transferase domain-containing protein [Streptomyces sp. KL116D]|uniref:carboxyl transferase domain-containing protein n=1 Tax=Streptomyces sp. KL116D TaxID=3045152 RepID=UPI003557BD27
MGPAVGAGPERRRGPAGRRRGGGGAGRPRLPLGTSRARATVGRRPTSGCCGTRCQENRRRAYDVRAAVGGSPTPARSSKLRRGFGVGIVTALVRIEGRPLGLIANDPGIWAAPWTGRRRQAPARFLRLCEAFRLPVLSLCDTPGFMVGPDAERTATVRSSRTSSRRAPG